jgi:hypothetical protein
LISNRDEQEIKGTDNSEQEIKLSNSRTQLNISKKSHREKEKSFSRDSSRENSRHNVCEILYKDET